MDIKWLSEEKSAHKSRLSYLSAAFIIIFSSILSVGFYSNFYYSIGWVPQYPVVAPHLIDSQAPIAKTSLGTYAGFRNTSSGLDEFLGIAFAQPPTGDLRWRRPQPLVSSWDGVKEAIGQAPWCVGYGVTSKGHPGSEDCLYLNVYRPVGFDSVSLPVAVYIHGGGFQGGSGNDRKYDPFYLMDQALDIGKPFIYVTIDYRMSVWGFLNSEDVVREGITNLGLRDQRLALEWIQENIAAFGGNQSQVTIWGQSAGAASVGFQTLSRERHENRPLFRAAIMHSGSPLHYEAIHSTESRQPLYDEFIRNVGCGEAPDRLACLRQADFRAIQAAVIIDETNEEKTDISGQWSVAVDGDFVPAKPSELLDSGDVADVPIICGSLTNDGTLFVFTLMDTDADFRYFLRFSPQFIPALGANPDSIETILDLYPTDPYYACTPPLINCTFPSDPRGMQFMRAGTYLTDFMFNAGRRATVRTWSSLGQKTYSYHFNIARHDHPGLSEHNDDRMYLFNRTDRFVTPNLDEEEEDIDPFTIWPESYYDAMLRYSNSIISFIHDVDPNSWLEDTDSDSVDPIRWPLYNTENPQHIFFDAQMQDPSAKTRIENDDQRIEEVDAVIKMMPEFGR